MAVQIGATECPGSGGSGGSGQATASAFQTWLAEQGVLQVECRTALFSVTTIETTSTKDGNIGNK